MPESGRSQITFGFPFGVDWNPGVRQPVSI
jgi:hypothetical protein